MELLEIVQVLDTTSAVLVLLFVVVQLMKQVERVIGMVDNLVNRLVDIIDARNSNPPGVEG